MGYNSIYGIGTPIVTIYEKLGDVYSIVQDINSNDLIFNLPTPRINHIETEIFGIQDINILKNHVFYYDGVTLFGTLYWQSVEKSDLDNIMTILNYQTKPGYKIYMQPRDDNSKLKGFIIIEKKPKIQNIDNYLYSPREVEIKYKFESTSWDLDEIKMTT